MAGAVRRMAVRTLRRGRVNISQGAYCHAPHRKVHLAAGTGEHIAHQNETHRQTGQQCQGQQADVAAVGCHGQCKQGQHTDRFHSLSVLLHNHDPQSNVCFLDGYTIAHLFDECKQLFVKNSTNFRFSFCETYGKVSREWGENQ